MKYIPQVNPLVLDKLKFTDVISKLVEFNEQFQQDNPSNLQKGEIEAVRKLADVLEKTSYYHASQVEIHQITVLEKILAKWSPDKIFPAVDLLRMCLIHPSGLQLLNSIQPFAEFNSVFDKCLNLAEKNNFAIWLVVLRFFTNALAYDSTQKSMERIIEKLLNTISDSLPTMQKKAILVSLAHFLLNLSISVKNNIPRSTKVIQILVQLFDKEDKDDSVIFPTLVCLGTLALSNYANKSMILSNTNVAKNLDIYSKSTNSQIQDTSKELANVLS